MQKRGLSGVVVAILLILLTIIAILIVWQVIKRTLQKQEIEIGLITSDLDIRNAKSVNGNYEILLRRNPGEANIVGLKFVFENENARESYVSTLDYTMNELEEKTIIISGVTLPNVTKVLVYPIIRTEKGKDVTGPVKDTFKLRGTEEKAEEPQIPTNNTIVLNPISIVEDGYVEWYSANTCQGTEASSCQDYNSNQAACESNYAKGDYPYTHWICACFGPACAYCDAVLPCGATKNTSDTVIHVVHALANGDAKGYISWNTSAIPDTAIINSINFSFFTNPGISGPEAMVVMNITNMSGKKASDFSVSAAGNQNLWKNISSSFGNWASKEYNITIPGSPDMQTWKNLTLTNGANTTMQNQLSQDYFMFGLVGNYTGFSIDSKEGTNKPYLTVTYTA